MSHALLDFGFPAFETSPSPTDWSYFPAPAATTPPPTERFSTIQAIDFIQAAIKAWQDIGITDSAARDLRNLSVLSQCMAEAGLSIPEEVYVSASGSICFDWDENPTSQLSLMFLRSGRGGYAALIDGRSMHGEFAITGNGLPAIVASIVSDWKASQP